MTATYRLQVHAGFTVRDARAIVPYLAELGISHLYLSPILQAAEGSTHGYDVVDPERVAATLGGEDALAELAAATRAHGLAIMLDIVPNHMSIAGTGNRWWLDVLENGVASYYAHYFDVDWPSGDDRVALPVLEERYGRALMSGHLGVVHDGCGGFAVRAGELRLPIAPRAVGRIVSRAGERIRHAELTFVGDTLAALPRDPRPEARRRRHRDKAVLMARIAELCADPACAAAIDAEVVATCADPSELDALLETQAYRLVHWSVAASQLTYRRFFDISTLVGLRADEPDVFEATHARILRWLDDHTIAGVRIDHVDGLREPARYLARLRERAPGAWIVVEKILATDEELPAWPVDGTTGYDFADRLGRLLVNPASESALTTMFEAYTGCAFEPAPARRAARRAVMSDALHSELARLIELAARACASSPACRDFTRAEIEAALGETFAGYSTYRTYLGESDPRPEDRSRIAAAAAVAPGDPDLVAFVAAALAFELTTPDALELAKIAQQTTGAIVAKGDEDTLSYRLVRLASRCEVGADLARFSADPGEIHRAFAAGRAGALLATSTHDTKRSEDVRARIAVISEVPAAWGAAVTRWRARSDRHWGDVAADRTLEYLMWQTVVGAWPIDVHRARDYALKATREARLRTSWRKPDAVYEAALVRWCDGVFGDAELLADVAQFVALIAARGDANALAQLLIKLVVPGTPDFYQGCELVDRSLVDPDNRRPVDFARRRTLLHEVVNASAVTVARNLDLAKLWTIRRVLGMRRHRPELFAAPYAPVAAVGPCADRVFAFARGAHMIAVVPRIGAIDRETVLELPSGEWTDILSDRTHRGTVALTELWRPLPIALLTW